MTEAQLKALLIAVLISADWEVMLSDKRFEEATELAGKIMKETGAANQG